MGDIETIQRLRSAFGADVGADVGEDARRLIEVIEPVLDPEIEVWMAAGPMSDEYHGIDGLRAAWADFLHAFDSLRIEFGEMSEIGEAVLDHVILKGVPRGTTAEIEQPAAAVWRFRDGLLRRVEFHIDRDAARQSAASRVA